MSFAQVKSCGMPTNCSISSGISYVGLTLCCICKAKVKKQETELVLSQGSFCARRLRDRWVGSYIATDKENRKETPTPSWALEPLSTKRLIETIIVKRKVQLTQ